MGPKIYTAQGLPVLGADGAIPAGLVADYGTKICPADGFASVFPEHKYLIVETLRLAGFRCGMTGMYIYMCTYVCVCVRVRACGTLLLYHIATHTSDTVPFLQGTADTKYMYI